MTAWTPELLEQMKALHAQGLSCSVIAAELGNGFTRNAIIGKLHRSGIKNTGSAPIIRKDYNGQPRKRGKTRVYKRKPTFSFNGGGPSIPPTPLPDPDLSRTSGPSLLELTHGMCRWPFGDPQKRDGFFFCGDAAVYRSYCAAHAAKAFQPLPERRKARAA